MDDEVARLQLPTDSTSAAMLAWALQSKVRWQQKLQTRSCTCQQDNKRAWEVVQQYSALSDDELRVMQCIDAIEATSNEAMHLLNMLREYCA